MRRMKRNFWSGVLLVLVVTRLAGAKEKSNDLVDVTKAVPHVRLDIRYATTNNFTGTVLYPMAKCCLRQSTAKKLAAVQRELESMGLGLKIYDGYRPFSI